MSFFEDYFDIQSSDSKNVAVCCPFDHFTSNHIPYKEHNPSAHVDVEQGLFHCKVCDAGYNEITFIKEILQSSIKNAYVLQPIFKCSEDLEEWKKTCPDKSLAKQVAAQFNITDSVVEELNLTSQTGNDLTFPAFMYNRLIDVRKYTPGAEPKVRSRTGSPAGIIIPYDVWRVTDKDRITLICAGEKDMAVARSNGFNAITITGGEQALPICTADFVDRKIVIVYDNDEAGYKGALKLAEHLSPIASWVKVCSGFHTVCHENKEDITDFFNKYSKTKSDLIKFIEDTKVYESTPELLNAKYPIVDLHAASSQKYVGKLVRSNIQVVAMSEATFLIPTTIIGKKWRHDPEDKNATMFKDETKTWELNPECIQDILHLMDNNFTEDIIKTHYRSILKIPLKERSITFKTFNRVPVFKCVVTDLFETLSGDVVPMEYTAYAVGTKLESGKKYMVTHKLVPHPYKGQQLVMLITSNANANDSVTNFKITDEVKNNLNVFKNLEGTVSEKVNYITEKVKGLLGFNANRQLIQAIDLSYHTVLAFNFGRFKYVRGYLDTFVVGESRIGKSSTANALRSAYKLGVFTSLAGTAATIPGLIGGSNKQNGSFQTRAGLIPQNHKGLIIFEEFGKSNNNVITELTDIRSSNEVRITRVSGTLTLPAMVRMITLTNTKVIDGIIKPISTYPNGISVITELIGTAEDIARYDLLVVLGTRGSKHIDPLWEPEEPFTDAQYQTRVRWVWSRTAEQIILSDEITRYIVEKSNELNDSFDSHIKIFGTEAWKKISRLAIAVAGYLVSTDATYEQIIVTKDHVDFAVSMFLELYDNQVFRLKEYVTNERKYSTIDDEGVAALQDLYMKVPSVLLHLEQVARTSKNTMQAATGLTNDEYNKIINRLVSGAFIQLSKFDIIPTERFRRGMYKIERRTFVPRVGDVSVTV